jgi:hypothetical protein
MEENSLSDEFDEFCEDHGIRRHFLVLEKHRITEQ